MKFASDSPKLSYAELTLILYLYSWKTVGWSTSNSNDSKLT
ncbi:hypothetical protein LEP1GSC125_0994 [Leptospira mayottensis 200901122]|uniref:Uncharacterized protein n=1 Tax=Leptospira mayottensis 200901122 TaxID=1193010 RepID=A0AA87ML11_9LEPT|nr:hypothetical protein LEP1GSC125_0994 [Leptospira mayottensis 200901122]